MEKTKQDVYEQQLQSITVDAHNNDAFGSLTYEVGGELSRSQERINFLERYLAD